MKLRTLAVVIFSFSLATIIANSNASVQAYQPVLLTAGSALTKAV